jgi:penicillin-binding protein 2
MPTFDPNLFVEGIDQQSWDELNTSPDKPMVNRPLSGTYPPGSTYKPFMALAALELGKRTPMPAISDPGYFMFGNTVPRRQGRRPRHGGHVQVHRPILRHLLLPALGNDMGVDMMHDFMKPFGFGQITGIDLEHEKQGILPSTAWKRNRFKPRSSRNGIAGDTISLGIGQGYNSFTPLQMAHAVPSWPTTAS